MTEITDDPGPVGFEMGGHEMPFGELLRPVAEGHPPPSLRESLNRAEAWCIRHALDTTRGNRAAAARILRIGRRTLYSKMQKLGL